MARTLLAFTVLVPVASVSLQAQHGQRQVHEFWPDTGNCSWIGVTREDICYRMNRWYLLDIYGPHLPRHGILDMTKLERNLWVSLRKTPTLRAEFFEDFETLSKLRAVDVLAMKETWEDLDTMALQDLVLGSKIVGPNGVPMNLTTENMRSILPSIKDLERLVKGKSLAIVGGGKSLKAFDHGEDIDMRDQVVRFHGNMGNALNPKSAGTKHTMHVINWKRTSQKGVTTFDLGTDNLLRDYCERLMVGGKRHHPNGAPLFMIKPTGYCKLPKRAAAFTREFLFYWLIGSLSDDVTFFGIMDNSTATKFEKERFMEVEQKFYTQAAYQWIANDKDLALLRGPKPEVRIVS